MQDGTTGHTARCVRNVIQANFPDERVISRAFPTARRARSPGFNPFDFWLWSFLKDRVYQGDVTNVVDLNASIVGHVFLFPAVMLRAATDNAVVRFQHIVDRPPKYAHRTRRCANKLNIRLFINF